MNRSAPPVPAPAPAERAAATASDPLAGRTLAGVRLEGCLGSGGQAVVYRGRRMRDDTRVVMKILLPEAAKDESLRIRFSREAQLCQRISHPGIVAVHAIGLENGIHFIEMELVTGPSMETVIDHHGRLPWKQALRLFLHIAQAMTHLETVGIVHRDIKPANIILCPGGRAKLIDLGFAKQLSDDSELGGLTMAGTTMGSPAYMPPEQVEDAREATMASDIYGLGASIYHAVTGRPPFEADTAHQTIHQVLHQNAVGARMVEPSVPPALSALLDWMLLKEPARRPPSAAIVIRALEHILDHPDDAPFILRQVPRAPRRIPAWLWLALGILGVAGLLLGVVLWLRLGS